MKKFLVSMLSIMMLFGFFSNSSVLASGNREFVEVQVDGVNMSLKKVSLNIDGVNLEGDVPAVAYEENTLGPARLIGEALGADVSWDNESRSAVVVKGSKEIILPVNSDKALINGVEKQIPNDAMVKLASVKSVQHSSTMVPFRFIAEELNADVDWDSKSFTAVIESQMYVKPIVIPKKEYVNINIDSKTVRLAKVNLKINNVFEEGKVPSFAYKSNTLTPVRLLSEALGAEVGWDQNSLSAIVRTHNKDIVLPVNSNKVLVNGVQKTIPNGGMVKLATTSAGQQASTMIPFRFIAEELGASVDWDNDTFTADIKSDTLKGPSKPMPAPVNNMQSVGKEIVNGKEAIVVKNLITTDIKAFNISNPSRVVLDLRNTNSNGVNVNLGNNIIKSTRSAQYAGKEYKSSEKVTRIVFDIADGYSKPTFRTQKRGSDTLIFIDAVKVKPLPPVIKPPTNIGRGKTVVVDAGHGGHDPGAVANGLREKDLALNVALKTESKLKNMGYNVVMTRKTDKFVTLSGRYQIANRVNSNAFISVHFNSAAGTKATGIETLYSNKNSRNKRFAQDVQNQIISQTGERNRGLKYRNGLAVLRGTRGPSALAELGFLNNPNDARKIKTNAYLNKSSTALANGINNYLSR